MSNYSQNNLQLEEKNTSWAKIFEYVPESTQVLDVGCSDGRLGAELKKRKNCRVYGIEIDPGDFADAKKVLDGVFSVNIESEALPPALAHMQFDAIILADVIEHFVDPINSLKKLKKLLRPNGRLIFSIPNMSHISVRLQLLGGRLVYGETGLLDRTHLHFYDYKEVTRVFTNAGLKIIENNANSLPYPRSFLEKKLDELGLSDKGYIQKVQTDINAQSFQFVGYAQAVQDEKNIRQISLSTRTPEQELTDYIESLNTNMKSLNKSMDLLRQELSDLQATNEGVKAEADALRQRMDKITSSLSWRVASKIRRSVRKLKPKS